MPKCMVISKDRPNKLDEFLAYLAVDGGWHTLKDVAEVLRIAERKVLTAERFFTRFSFVEFNREAGIVRVDPKIRKWYTEEP